jgi:hypothetical protein
MVVGPTIGVAQPFEQQVGPFPVRDTAGNAYEMPFLGGFNTPRPQLVDLDGDGDLDLFVQERLGRLAYFENTGSPSSPRFEWRSDDFRGLDVGAWARFGDLDDDGDPDLLAEEPISNVRYYENEGTPSEPRFARATGPLQQEDDARLFAERQNVPALASLDCEGAPDLFLGDLNGRLRYLRHDGTGNDAAPVFETVSDAYQDVCVGPASVCGVSSEPSKDGGSFSRLHGANVIAAGDLGGDGDPDFLWGDFFSDSLYLLENTGSCENPQIERVSDVYPVDDPIQTSGYNAPFLGDLDGDGALDLLVGVLGGGGSSAGAVENLLYLNNTGSAAQPDYTVRTRRFLYTVDVGGVSAPAIVDLDGDGDRDVVVGNNLEPGGTTARLHLFENVGSDSTPVLRHRSAPLLPDGANGDSFVPAFADVDADGDPDLFVGTFSGTVRFYRNTGGDGSPQFVREPEHDVGLPGGNYATPALVDIDGDGDPDLFVGSSSGEGVVAFFRNEGTSQVPDFQLAEETYASIRAGLRRTHPAFGDPNGDGAPDLYLGTVEGVSFYENTGTPEAAAFDAAPDSVALPLRSLAAPALADLDGDGELDLLAGGEGGGLKFFAGCDESDGECGDTSTDRDTTADNCDITEPPPISPEAGVCVAPNPFPQRTQLIFSLGEAAPVRLSVYDVMGRRVSVIVDRSLPAAEHTVSFDGTGRASGVYLYVLRVDGRVRDRGRIVLVR